jgi:inosine-uridine nucleoside N-ribohydrolase
MFGVRRLASGVLIGALAGAAACGGPAAPTAQVAPARGMPVIVDTDMASDDIMALAYLLDDPAVSVRAITVEGTGVAHGLPGARNALRLIRALRIRQPIPVGYGPPSPLAGSRSFPLAWRAGADAMYGLGLAMDGLGLPAWRGPQPAESAVRLLVRTITRSPRPVRLITLGPLTDVALALRADPGIADKIAGIYAMAGAVRVPGNEPVHGLAEWNVYIDPTAAARVLRSGIPMTFIPLDASDNVPITPFFRNVVQAHPRTRALRLVANMLRDPYYSQAPVYFWDPLAAVTATDQRAVRLQPERLVIGTAEGPGRGVTRVSPSGTTARVAVWASAPAFQRQFLTVLNGGRPLPVPTVPAARRLAVSFDGSSYRYHGPRGAPAGPLQVRLADRSPVALDSFGLVIGKLLHGRTLADVQAVIRRGTATRVPAWFKVAATIPAAPYAQPAWGVTLGPGRYALVCQRVRDGAWYALTTVIIR